MILTTVLSTTFNTLLLAWFVRRLIGVPVGWPRTILLSLAFGAGMTPVVRLYSRLTGVDLTNGGEPRDLESILLVLLLVGWLLAIEAAILIIAEVVVPTGDLPGPISLARSLPSTRRRIRRYLAVLGILVRHGLIGNFGRRQNARLRIDDQGSRTLVRAFMDGGVTFIKLGQMLATRPDIIPTSLARSLGDLHDRADPAPWQAIEPILVESLGQPIDAVFEHIDTTPVAAASVAQVHVGRLHGGREVIVKIQRPGAREQVMVDLDILTRVARRLEQRTGWARSMGLCRLISGFAQSLHEELDYTVELENTRAVEASLASAPRRTVLTPRVHDEISGRRILVMDRARGRSLSRADDIVSRLELDRRRNLADDLVATMLQQVLVTGVFHADPHAGNIFVDTDGALTLIDFGAVGRLSRTARSALTALLVACSLDSPVAATDALISLVGRPADLDDHQLEQDLGEILTRAQGDGASTNSQRLFRSLLAVVVDHGLTIPNQLAAAFRCFSTLEGALRTLDPAFTLVASVERQRHTLVSVSDRLSGAGEQLLSQAFASSPLMLRVPRRVDSLLTDIGRGRLQIRLAGIGSPGLPAFDNAILSQFVLALIAGSCSVCGILLMMVPSTARLTAQVSLGSAVGSVFLLFGFTLAARIVALMIRAADR
ncbi:MAG: AarF/ABC1/UbiB kinase family protein [Dermatophilaceae bacterium]